MNDIIHAAPVIHPYTYSVFHPAVYYNYYHCCFLLHCYCYFITATSIKLLLLINRLQARLLSGAAELTTHLLRLISILWLPLCRINKLGLLPSKTVAIPYTCGLSGGQLVGHTPPRRGQGPSRAWGWCGPTRPPQVPPSGFWSLLV